MLFRSVSHENGKDQNEEQAEAKVEEQRQRVELAHVRPNVRVDADHGRRGQRVVDVALPARVPERPDADDEAELGWATCLQKSGSETGFLAQNIESRF